MVRVTFKLHYSAIDNPGEHATVLITYPAGGWHPFLIGKLGSPRGGAQDQSKIYLLRATVAAVAPDALINCLLVRFRLFTALCPPLFSCSPYDRLILLLVSPVAHWLTHGLCHTVLNLPP